VEDVRENMYYFGEWPGVIRPELENWVFYKEPATVEKTGSEA
jgi:hypothetical protein